MFPKSDNAALKTLEFDAVLEKVADLSVSAVGRERVENLFLYTDGDLLKKELGRVTEMRDLLRSGDSLPLQVFADLRSSLERVEVEGAFLQPEGFVELHHFLVMVRQTRACFDERPEKYPLLWELVKKTVPLPEMEKEIGRVIDPSGEVKDRASELLSRLRRQISKKGSQVRRRLEEILRSLVSRGHAQEDALVLKEGRLVIPVKEPHRGGLKGIVVDQSASGATVFMEPLEVVELNNDIRYFRIQERQEVERILKELTDRVREKRLEIVLNIEVFGEMDCVMARAKFSVGMDGNAAVVEGDGILEFKNARHPLLLMRENREEVVPLILRMGGELGTLVITGPNAGGKTVALKTVGLLALMHQHGLHVSADEGTSFPLFSRVFADIGDHQSIEQDLSTFSSHIENIKLILEKADSTSLVLLDEIGSSTDPAEGSALAEVILKHLTQKGCLTVATTHMGTLKVFAHEEPGVGNGSMAFDRKTLRPTYRFQMGLPGSSYAFEIGERLGLEREIVEEARCVLGEERGKLDRLIFHLEEELQRTHGLLEEAEIKESRLSGLVKLYQERIERIQKEGEERKRKIVEEAEEVLQEANAAVERVVREIREKGAAKESIREAKEALRAHRKKVAALSREKERAEIQPASPGDWVVWQGHGGVGKVVSEPDRTGRVLVLWNDRRLRVSVDELKPGEAPEEKFASSGLTHYRVDRSISDEIDLRGMTADEAIEEVEGYLGDVVMAGIREVRIIHGKGTGVLRREIGRYLKGHSLVKSHRTGSWGEGDTGVTIVELK